MANKDDETMPLDPSIPIVKREIQQSSPAGRSVVDYSNLTDLRNALETVSLRQNNDESAKSDWKLPVPDPEAHEQTVDGELKRLWTLKSYLLLDAEQEQAFDELTEEARQHYNVPTCLISLVDLGRQFLLSTADANDCASNTTPPSRETPRSVAFCAHTILSKRGICVVPDTKEDDRFKHNPFVTEPPYLRFYAGAPLLSPEGYKLGTFCVEGPEPRPGGLSTEEQEKLQEFAAKAMQLMAQRRQVIQERLMAPILGNIRRHAAVTTNVGIKLYSHGECVAAMKLFQESVQALMSVKEEDSASTSVEALPTVDRQEEMAQLLNLLSSENHTEQSRRALIERAKFLALGGGRDVSPPSVSPATAKASCGDCLSCTAFLPDNNGQTSSCQRPCHHDDFPGLFGDTSRLKGSAGRKHPTTLVFNEPFLISMEDSKDGKVDYRNFIIPLDQCSKATIFNMGLIHYHWGSPDTAMQFFDLAASLSQASTPLDFDPVVLGCLNNMAQIHLHYGKPNDAMELLADALTRGNAALAAMYSSCDDLQSREQDDFRSRRLRRKLARTVMNMGHVHFYLADFDASMRTCGDAIRLLHTTNFEDAEAASAWYNIGILHHHQGDRMAALKFLDKFIDRAQELVGHSQHQVADALYRKGQVLFETGNLYECMKPLNESLRIRREKCGDNHTDVAESLCLIGKVLQAREEYDFALNALEEGLSIIKSQPEGGAEISLEAAQTMLEIGSMYHIQGNRKEALRVYNEVADVARKFFGDRHPYVARIVNIIGTIHLEAGEVEESLRHFEDASKMCVEQGLPVDMSVVSDPLLGCKRPASDVIAPTA